MKTVFVSGCYDVLHAGHIQFFKDAKALGDRLVVCFASDDVLEGCKQRRASLPQEHKRIVLESLCMVDEVVIGTNREPGMDFKGELLRVRPDILAVTEDDRYAEQKRKLCEEVGVGYCVLPKTPPECPPVSSSAIIQTVCAPKQVPLRIDMAGGWLDVPRLARRGAFIVNCAISPLVSLREWIYAKQSGLGGSSAWALLNGENGVNWELDLGVGWQDPAVIQETGICVWRSGPQPELEMKTNGDLLRGRVALYFTGSCHDTPSMVNRVRDYDMIEEAGRLAAGAVREQNFSDLAKAVNLSYQAQILEGMARLPVCDGACAQKYCGGGHGGYAMYLFDELYNRNETMIAVEPYIRGYQAGDGGKVEHDSENLSRVVFCRDGSFCPG